jgi:hypothetical protein
MLSQCHAQLVGGCLHVLRFLFLDGKQAIVAIPARFKNCASALCFLGI